MGGFSKRLLFCFLCWGLVLAGTPLTGQTKQPTNLQQQVIELTQLCDKLTIQLQQRSAQLALLKSQSGVSKKQITDLELSLAASAADLEKANKLQLSLESQLTDSSKELVKSRQELTTISEQSKKLDQDFSSYKIAAEAKIKAAEFERDVAIIAGIAGTVLAFVGGILLGKSIKGP